ncbi:hypothetical protein DFJ74DRAFT_659621 [Hyaloraphidium curvatum]|nr:hypothetical protein DFJ74DRAFT_659621 [Hyaloraphidium curvatum]
MPLKDPQLSKRGLLPGYRTAASPALNRPDVPQDIVGPLVAFHGVDLDTKTWRGSILVLVRREPRGNEDDEGERRKKADPFKDSVLEPLALADLDLRTRGAASPAFLQPTRAAAPEDGDGDLVPTDSQLTQNGDEALEPSPNKMRSNSEVTIVSTDVPPPEPDRTAEGARPVGLSFRRTSSHELEDFRNRQALPSAKPGAGALAGSDGTDEDISARPWIEVFATKMDSGKPEVPLATLRSPTVLYRNECGYTAFRFDLEIPQDEVFTTFVRYRVMIENPELYRVRHDELDMYDLHVPAVNQKWHCAFFSCSGFEHTNREADQGVGTPGLWHDILRVHRGRRADANEESEEPDENVPRPFHLLIGGGDQVYNDDVFDDVHALHDWMYDIPYQRDREAAPWTQEMEHGANEFYFRNCCMHFGTTVVGDAMARIPHVFVPDDHDFFDGFGSYPEHLNNCPVFQGIAKVATKQFLLFQHHTTPELAASQNCMIPADPNGPFGRPSGFNFVYNLSPTMSIVGLDNRTERQIDQVFFPATLDAIFQRINATVPRTCEHLLVMQAVPMIFGDIGSLERPLERISKFIRNNKFATEVIAKLKLYRSDQLKFGEPQLLDDMVDHWTSMHHLLERQLLFARFGQVAKEFELRVSWLTGDVHCAGFGRLRTIGVTTETEIRDPMTQYQVISSAIGNAPPPVFVRAVFEYTDGPPWGAFRKRTKPPLRRPTVTPGGAASVRSMASNGKPVKSFYRANTYHEKLRNKYAEDFVARPIKNDPGNGQVVLGKVEEGLVSSIVSPCARV